MVVFWVLFWSLCVYILLSIHNNKSEIKVTKEQYLITLYILVKFGYSLTVSIYFGQIVMKKPDSN